MHPDLTKRLATEAAESADRVLQMCIRAIDYCPPVDITFGDFLRGIVTADVDFSPGNEHEFRIVCIESFREWGIHPRGLTSMGLDELVWPSGDQKMASLAAAGKVANVTAPTSQESLRQGVKGGRSALKEGFLKKVNLDWTLESDRFEVWKKMGDVSKALWEWLREGGDSYGRDYAKLFGLVINEGEAPPTVYRRHYDDGPEPAMEVHAVRPTTRRTTYGGAKTHLVVEITQRRRGYFDREKQKLMDNGSLPIDDKPDFKYRAGCTLLLDPSTQEIRRVMCTAGDIADNKQLDRIRKFLLGETGENVGNAFDAGIPSGLDSNGARGRFEPFAFLHHLGEEE